MGAGAGSRVIKLTPTDQFNYVLMNEVLKLRLTQSELKVVDLEKQIAQSHRKRRRTVR